MAERIILPDFNYFGGKHCQTAALKNSLSYQGLDFSEEMLLGLGGGIGFIYWYAKRMPAPFIGARHGKGDEFLLNLSRRIGAQAELFQTSSSEKAYQELKETLRAGQPAYLFVDMAYLPYMILPEEAHFGGHTILVWGLDEVSGEALVSERAAGPLRLSLADLKRARNSTHPPFPPRNRMLKLTLPQEKIDLQAGIQEALRDCCQLMLKPPIKNIGLAGMEKWAQMVIKWPALFEGLGLLGCLFNTFIYIEIGGTGGAAFRPMYARFLKESASILDQPGLIEAAEMFEESANVWRQIAAAALPHSRPPLGRLRELMSEKNRVFEEQKEGAWEKMRALTVQIDDLMPKALADLAKNDPAGLLADLSQKILDCRRIESQAFQALAGLGLVSGGFDEVAG